MQTTCALHPLHWSHEIILPPIHRTPRHGRRDLGRTCPGRVGLRLAPASCGAGRTGACGAALALRQDCQQHDHFTALEDGHASGAPRCRARAHRLIKRPSSRADWRNVGRRQLHAAVVGVPSEPAGGIASRYAGRAEMRACHSRTRGRAWTSWNRSIRSSRCTNGAMSRSARLN